MDVSQLSSTVNRVLNQYEVQVNAQKYGIGNKEFSLLLVSELFKEGLQLTPKPSRPSKVIDKAKEAVKKNERGAAVIANSHQ